MDKVFNIAISGIVFALIAFVMVVVLYALVYSGQTPDDALVFKVGEGALVARAATTNAEADLEFTRLPREIDGVVLATGDIVLVKNQTDSSLNGPCTVYSRGDYFALSRIPVNEGSVVYVAGGSQKGERFMALDDEATRGKTQRGLGLTYV